MQSDDQQLRDRLDAIAGQAAPLALSVDLVHTRVKRRRGLMLATAGAGSVAVIYAVAFALAGLAGGTPLMVATPGPSYSPGPTEPPALFMCGERYDVPDSATVGPLSVAVAAHKVSETTGPAITATFRTTRPVFVAAGRPSGLQVLYLNNGVIVGGGPMLNQVGDTRGQGVDPVRDGFEVGPTAPHELDVGPRDTLCGSLTWPDVWSSVAGHEVVLILGPVEPGPDELRLLVPPPGPAEGLIVARTRLSPAR